MENASRGKHLRLCKHFDSITVQRPAIPRPVDHA
ncbi:hypothetical protein JOE38_001754 [Clavibacter michiganensis]|nr:hypothetical protein [Clavibacter michiganensis]